MSDNRDEQKIVNGITPERRDRFTAAEDDFEIISPPPKKKKKMVTARGGMKKDILDPPVEKQ